MGYKGDINDINIIVVGPTGSGKTRFIGALGGKAKHGVNLEPDTETVTPYIIPCSGRIQLQGRLVLLDTPGLNEVVKPDAMMLREILDGVEAKLAGLIYLHRITDNRMPGSIHQKPRLLCQCSKIAPSQACLVTTMWDKIGAKNMDQVKNRERELNDYWQPLMNEGAGTRQFDNSSDSAWRIITDILPRGAEVVRPNPRNKTGDTVCRCFGF